MKKSRKYAINLIKKYGFKSVFFKTLLKMTLLIMVPISLLCVSTYYICKSSIMSEIKSNALNSFERTSNATMDILDEIEKNYTLFSSSNYVNSFISSPDIESDGLKISNTVMQIENLMKNYINTTSYVDTIYLYCEKNDFVLSSYNSNYLRNFADKPWLSEYKKGTPYFILPEQNGVVSVCYNLSKTQNSKALLVFNVNVNNFLSTINSGSDLKNTTIVLFNSQNEPILQSNKSNPSQILNMPKNKLISTTDENISSYQNSEYIYHYQLIKKFDTVMAREFSLDYFNDNMWKLQIILIIGILLSFMLPFAISFYISLQSYYSIAEIAGQFYDIVNTGNTETSNKTNNEILDINKNIMNMSTNYNGLKHELVEKITALKYAQSLALQNQINPHFLFNTLNMVNLMIMKITKKDCPPIMVISLLSELMSEALEDNNYVVTLHKELSCLEKYIKIEEIKYTDKFAIEWDIDQELFKSKAIKFSLQPLVENAFNHGIYCLKNKKGLLKISIKLVNDKIEYTIEDNGIGISVENLAKIRNSLSSNDLISTKHIGLCNVNSRIKLIFGEDYGIKINSDENGTKVTISTPNQIL